MSISKPGLAFSLLVLSLSPAWAAFADDSLIEIGADEGVYATPIEDASGNEVQAMPVAIIRDPDGTTEVRPMSARNRDAYFTGRAILGAELSRQALGVSVSFGVVFGSFKPDPTVGGQGMIRGVLMQVEPGLTGGELSVGYASGAYGKIIFVPMIGAGWALKASALRTWGLEAGDTMPGQTYLGAEGSLAILLFKISAGIFRQIDGPTHGGLWLTRFGFGVGL